MKKFNFQSYGSHVGRMNNGGVSSEDLLCSH